MRVPRGPRDGRSRLSQKRLPTYTVFAKPQMLPALLQEKLNRAERAAAADINRTDRHRGWHGRVEKNEIPGHKAGRGTHRGQPPRHRGRPKSERRLEDFSMPADRKGAEKELYLIAFVC